jgi:hypothetical protein
MEIENDADDAPLSSSTELAIDCALLAHERSFFCNNTSTPRSKYTLRHVSGGM